MLPQSWLQVVVIVVAVMPGFVFQTTLRGLSGPDPEEKDVSIRLLRAVITTAVFVGTYCIAAGPWIADHVPRNGESPGDVRLLGIGALALGVAVPWAAAWARYVVTASSRWRSLLAGATTLARFRRTYDPTPTAWDHAFRGRTHCWVRVLTGDGRWVGGWFGAASYASGWPEPHDLFLEMGYAMNAEGQFTGEATGLEGCFVRCDDARLIEFIPDSPSTGAGA